MRQYENKVCVIPKDESDDKAQLRVETDTEQGMTRIKKTGGWGDQEIAFPSPFLAEMIDAMTKCLKFIEQQKQPSTNAPG